jgi:hypothetical protein
MRALLYDLRSVEEDGQGGTSSNSSNTTATQQGGQGHEHTYTHEHEPIFEFTSWDEGLDFFDLPASVAGGETARYCGDAVVDSDEDCDDGTGNGPAFRCRYRSLSFSLSPFSFLSLCPSLSPSPSLLSVSLSRPLSPSLVCARHRTICRWRERKMRASFLTHEACESARMQKDIFVILL